MKWLIIYVVLIIVTICINGHEYYRANFAHKGFLGIHLNDGTPIKCTIKEE